MVETIAGKGGLTHDHPVHAGPIGIVGSTSANALAAEADVILAIGTRLQDFTTGSWTAFARDARFISINAARFDAVKHRALSVVGDALETVAELDAALGDWAAPGDRLKVAKGLFAEWNAILDEHQAPTNAPVPSYAQVIGVMNKVARPHDTLIGAAGGTPGEITKNWRVKDPNTFDCEFGFSCMGYEIAAGWGYAMAQKGPGGLGGTPIVMVGDGTYMMMNSDIYSAVLTGDKMIVVVCDNGGFAVINRLQQFKGVPGFNNLLEGLQDRDARQSAACRFRQACRGDGRGGAACRKPRGPRRGVEMGAGERRDHGDQHRVGCLRLGAGRCRLGRRRAGSVELRKCRRGAQGAGSYPRQAARGGVSMEAKLGIAPIAWWNDDLEELSDDVSLEECLRQASVAGFTGMETGRRFPMNMAELGPILRPLRYLGLRRLVLGPAAGRRHRGREGPYSRADGLLHRRGRPCIVYGETARSIQGDRSKPLATKPKLTEDEIRAYARKMTAFGEWCADQGMPLAYHHHMAAAIETEPELDLFMRHSGEGIPLLFDAGHMAFAGGDVLRVIDKHHARISHVHTKDVRMEVIDALDRSRESFLDAVVKGAFTVPGDGSLDFAAIVQRLAAHGYEGWFVVEAEQDPKVSPPLEMAKKGHEELMRVMALAGYEVVQ